jgi:rare lipoprotein A
MSLLTRGCRALPLILAIALAGCASADRPLGGYPRPDIVEHPKRHVERGVASWYGPKFHGRATASGETFDMNRPSAAHRTLPFGTWVRVQNLDNGKSSLVRINDRGPFVRGRILDLSRAAAHELDMIVAGIARVEIRVVPGPETGLPEQPAATARSPTGGATWLQLGAFLEPGRAFDLAQSLRDLDRRVAVYSSEGWHRVQIRELADAAEAQRLRRRLRKRGVDAVLVAADSR